MTDERSSVTRRTTLKTALASIGISPFLSETASADSGDVTIDSELSNVTGQTEVIISLSTSPLKKTDVDSFAELSRVELRQAVEQSQEPTLDELRRLEGVNVRRSFWIGNAVFASVDTSQTDLKDDIASLSDVQAIYKNQEIAPPEPVEAPLHEVSTEQSHETTYGLEQISAPTARDEFDTAGEGARVAVVDTGIDPDHPAHQSFDPDNFAEFTLDAEEVDTDPRDPDDHGTHVSGTILGDRASDATGTEREIGVAPGAELLSAKVFSRFDGQTSATTAQVVAGIEWAVNNNADVINQSLGSVVSEESVYDEFYLEVMRDTLAAGVLPVASAGNNGQGLTGSPGNVRESFSIAANNEQFNLADFSSGEQVYTETAWGNNAPDDYPSFYTVPDVSGPGVGVLSSVAGGGYAELSGTSMSAPHVAGTAGLVLSVLQDPSPQTVQSIIEETAVHPDGPAVEDTEFGVGVINALGALADAAGGGVVEGTVTVGSSDSTGLQPGDSVTVDLDNVGSEAWEVVDVSGATTDRSAVVAEDGDNPILQLVEGVEYSFVNLPGGSHPLAFRNDSGEALLTQDGIGTFEDDSTVGWTDTDDSVSFTLSEDLAAALTSYHCTIHSSMASGVLTQSASTDADAVSGFEVTSDFGTYAFTGEDGSYELQLASGDHELIFDTFGLQSDSTSVSVTDGDSITVDTVLQPEVAVNLLSLQQPPVGEAQPRELTRGESFDILLQVANLETVTIEFGAATENFAAEEVSFAIPPLDAEFGIGETVEVGGVSDTIPLTVNVGGGSELAQFATDGEITTEGVREAIAAWRAGDIEVDLLRDVIEAWRNNEEVTSGTEGGTLELSHTFTGPSDDITVSTGPTEVLVGEPATFDITDATLPEVTGGDLDADDDPNTITVSATIENTGDVQGTQEVTYGIEQIFATSSFETIPAGETLTYETSVSNFIAAGLAGIESTHSIATEDDVVQGPFAVGQPEQGAGGEFLVDSLSAPDTISAGETVEVTVTIENTRPESFSSLIEYDFDIRASDADSVITPEARAVSIDAESTTEVTFSLDTDGILPGTYEHGVRTATDSQFAEIVVEPAE